MTRFTIYLICLCFRKKDENLLWHVCLRCIYHWLNYHNLNLQ